MGDQYVIQGMALDAFKKDIITKDELLKECHPVSIAYSEENFRELFFHLKETAGYSGSYALFKEAFYSRILHILEDTLDEEEAEILDEIATELNEEED